MNLNKEQVATVAENTLSDIAKIVGISESRFHFFHYGDLVLEDSLVLIEISTSMMDKNIMKSVSGLFYNEIKKYGNYETHVIFHELSDKPYVNGEQRIHKPK